MELGQGMATLPGGSHVDGSGLSEADRDILTRAFSDLGIKLGVGTSNLVHAAAGDSLPAATPDVLNAVELTSAGSQSSVTLPDGYQAAVLGNVGNLSVSGNGSDNLLAGNGDANSMDGGGGDDQVFGFGGNDTLFGGAGHDTLLGGL